MRKTRARRARKGEGSVGYSPTLKVYVGYLELAPKNGKRRRKRIQGPTRAEVETAIADARAALNATAGDLTLDRHLDEWIASPDVTGLRQSTRESYADTVRLHVRPYLGSRLLIELTPARLDDWLTELKTAKRPIATIRYAKIVLRIALQRAVRRDVLERNPLSALRVKGGTRRAPQALTPVQVGRLLDTAKPWMRTAILVGTLGGLRRGEVCGLQWDDFNAASSSLHVERSISAVSGKGEPKTEAGRRLVFLPPLVVEALAAHRRRLEKIEQRNARRKHRTPKLSPWIFPAEGKNAQPKHPRNFSHAYEYARAKAGLPSVRFHDLRHTFATALISGGYDVKAISQMLGHADVRTTIEMYHHPDREAQRRGAEGMQQWIGPVSAE